MELYSSGANQRVETNFQQPNSRRRIASEATNYFLEPSMTKRIFLKVIAIAKTVQRQKQLYKEMFPNKQPQNSPKSNYIANSSRGYM